MRSRSTTRSSRQTSLSTWRNSLLTLSSSIKTIRQDYALLSSMLYPMPTAVTQTVTSGAWTETTLIISLIISLPGGKPLSNVSTRQAVSELFEVFASNAEKLAPIGSSQRNEALNNTILSKLPKTKFYGGSESNDFQVAAAVLQKSTGRDYVSTVCQSVDLSPGRHSQKYPEQQTTAVERQLNFKSAREGKKRRNELSCHPPCWTRLLHPDSGITI